MNNFPLYDTLIKDIKTTDLTLHEKDNLIKNIKKLDDNGFEILYALIRVYHINNEQIDINFSIPYEGKVVKNDIKFDLEILPNNLKQLIQKFIFIHLKIHLKQ